MNISGPHGRAMKLEAGSPRIPVSVRSRRRHLAGIQGRRNPTHFVLASHIQLLDTMTVPHLSSNRHWPMLCYQAIDLLLDRNFEYELHILHLLPQMRRILPKLC